LAAPTTHRSLALLELKSALEEAMAARVGLERGASASALLAEIDRQNLLDKQSFEELTRVLEQMKKAESQVLASEPRSVSVELVESVRSAVLRLISTLDGAQQVSP
jgi:hypothetical protein